MSVAEAEEAAQSWQAREAEVRQRFSLGVHALLVSVTCMHTLTQTRLSVLGVIAMQELLQRYPLHMFGAGFYRMLCKREGLSIANGACNALNPLYTRQCLLCARTPAIVTAFNGKSLVPLAVHVLVPSIAPFLAFLCLWPKCVEQGA
eukprot:1157207-Pelagomonas_calceolata.AAC.5